MSSPLPVIDRGVAVAVEAAPDPAAAVRSPLRRRLARLLAGVAALALVAAVPAAFELGRATAPRVTAPPAAPSATQAGTPAAAESAAPVALPDGPWLDAEYDYLGALRTWPARAGYVVTDPFRGLTEGRLVAAGRTVCTRAQDPGMNADGMLDLLDLDPHQTFVVVTESLDKLCPSQSSRLAALTTGA
jgi:hypothetical protein